MMIAEGNLAKMQTEIQNNLVHYYLTLGADKWHMNELIGKTISMSYLHKIHCVSCGKLTKTSFGQGFCYSCFTTAPEAEPCVLHPEKCRAHLNESRDMEYAKAHCLIPHYVYLAVASGIKVGVTRHHQIPTRWIDQGAWKAMILAKTPNRHIAGIIEVYLKTYYSDKTNWKSMLKDVKAHEIDLPQEIVKAGEYLPETLKQFLVSDSNEIELSYPNLAMPDNPKSVNLDKNSELTGQLTGIKGQYLIIDNESVINLRKHSGYLIRLQSES
jgi:hypothetical protein